MSATDPNLIIGVQSIFQTFIRPHNNWFWLCNGLDKDNSHKVISLYTMCKHNSSVIQDFIVSHTGMMTEEEEKVLRQYFDELRLDWPSPKAVTPCDDILFAVEDDMQLKYKILLEEYQRLQVVSKDRLLKEQEISTVLQEILEKRNQSYEEMQQKLEKLQHDHEKLLHNNEEMTSKLLMSDAEKHEEIQSYFSLILDVEKILDDSKTLHNRLEHACGLFNDKINQLQEVINSKKLYLYMRDPETLPDEVLEQGSV